MEIGLRMITTGRTIWRWGQPNAGPTVVGLAMGRSTRQVVGCAVGEYMRADLVTDALDIAIRRRQPTGPMIRNSDRGSVDTSGHLARYARTTGCGCRSVRPASARISLSP
jgi:transposase InsO family protein